MPSLPRARAWRLRGRRAQVSAIATILGLLLVVTFIANYVTTTLPNQMQVNDLNHELEVENQMGRIQSLLEAATSAHLVGSTYTQPISLGSAGDPPFANPDGGSLGGVPGAPNPASISYSYAVSGALGYNPPSGFGAHNPTLPSGCTATSSSLSCGYVSSPLRANFSLATGSTFTPTLDDGSSLLAINVSTNSSTITFSNVQGFHAYLIVVGNHNTITINSNGAVNPSLIVIGNNNTINLNSIGGGNAYYLKIYGNTNTITGPGTAGSSTVYLTVYGIDNTWPVTSGGSDAYHVWFVGFNPSAPPTSGSCPVGGLSASNAVTGFTGANGATLTATFNNSSSANNPSSHSGTGSTIIYQTVASSTCPYTFAAPVSLSNSITPGAVLVTTLSNTYIPGSQVAFDEGAIVLAQTGGYPVMYEGPDLQYTGSALTLWLPQFRGTVGTTAGLGTSVVMFRYLGVQTFQLPSPGYSFPSSGSLNLTIQSPYAQAWENWLEASPTLSTLHPTCTPATVCTGEFSPNNGLGTVTILIPLSALVALKVQVATFAVSLS